MLNDFSNIDLEALESTPRASVLTTVLVRYNEEHGFYYNINGKVHIMTEEQLSLVGCTECYRLPINEEERNKLLKTFLPNTIPADWTKSIARAPISAEKANEIKDWWSRYKPGIKIKV
jgi:hypothetical protein